LLFLSYYFVVGPGFTFEFSGWFLIFNSLFPITTFGHDLLSGAYLNTLLICGV
jgi:hypothetical protein